MSDKVRIGVIGTSWWADAMHLPALTAHPLAEVRGVVGARPAHTREFADRWGVPGAYDTLEALLAAEPLDALVVLAPEPTSLRLRDGRDRTRPPRPLREAAGDDVRGGAAADGRG